MQPNTPTRQVLTTAREIESWESEGGATLAVEPEPIAEPMFGTESEVAHAHQIKQRLDAEFNRIAELIRLRADEQGEYSQMVTNILIAILESNRWAIISRKDAAYFIHNWQEIDDRVWRMVLSDARCQIIELLARRSANGQRSAAPQP